MSRGKADGADDFIPDTGARGIENQLYEGLKTVAAA